MADQILGGKTILAGALILGLLPAGMATAADIDGRQPAGRDWPMPEGDWGNRRFSSLTQINTTNVKSLGGTWTRKFENETSRSRPVVRDGLMFVTASAHVYAINPKTGDTVWSYTPPVPASFLLKGVAVGEGKVFIGLSDSRVVAVDEKTGKQVWEGMVADPQPPREDLAKRFAAVVGAPPTGQYVSAAPTYAKGLVIATLANGDYGIRGRVAAFDAKTGKRVWKFDTVPAPGEFGHDTWPKDNDSWTKGGGGVWMTPTIDPDLGLVYFGTGNPVPYYGGEPRPGNNLFTDSLVALDLKTGKYRWHFQAVHHDLWEFDLATPISLYDVEVAGKPRKGVGFMRDDGYLFLLDRVNGKPLIPIEERPVRQSAQNKTSPTQPYPVGAQQIVPNCIDKDRGTPVAFELSCFFDPVDLDRPNVAMPASAVRVAPMSFSPQTGYFYVAGGVIGGWHRRYEDPYFLPRVGLLPGLKNWGVLTAIDSKTDKIVWQKTLPYPASGGSGTTATAGGLVFHGETDGNLQAYDAKTGDLLWQSQTGHSVDGPPTTFEVDGEQYVAIMQTDATLLAFKLGGTLPQSAAATGPAGNPSTVGIAASHGRIVTTDQIQVGVVVRDMGMTGDRSELDEYQFSPARTKVKVGTKVTWTNGGKIAHDASAEDGAWTTGELAPGQSASVTFDKPGTYTYVDKQHPFVFATIEVE
jgi:quinohemoprotein ethanol dehydrogenase